MAVSSITQFPILTLYFAPWCPHSQEVMTVWNQLQQTLLGSQLSTIKVDSAETPDLVPPFVRAYPTIILTKNGRNLEFQGRRTLDNLLSFVQYS